MGCIVPRNYLNKDLVMREDMYLFQRQGKEYKVIDKGGNMYVINS